MKGIYRGVEIEAKRERALGGWYQVYWFAYRKSDGYGIADGFGGGSVRECFASLKTAVDEFLDGYDGDADKHGDAMRDYALYIAGMKPSTHREMIDEAQQFPNGRGCAPESLQGGERDKKGKS